jgi:hypothetical protein
MQTPAKPRSVEGNREQMFAYRDHSTCRWRKSGMSGNRPLLRRLTNRRILRSFSTGNQDLLSWGLTRGAIKAESSYRSICYVYNSRADAILTRAARNEGLAICRCATGIWIVRRGAGRILAMLAGVASVLDGTAVVRIGRAVDGRSSFGVLRAGRCGRWQRDGDLRVDGRCGNNDCRRRALQPNKSELLENRRAQTHVNRPGLGGSSDNLRASG